MNTAQELFNEWKDVSQKGISYVRAGIDDAMTEEMWARGESLFDRKKEIEGILLSMGYEIVDGEAPYSRELKKI